MCCPFFITPKFPDRRAKPAQVRGNPMIRLHCGPLPLPVLILASRVPYAQQSGGDTVTPRRPADRHATGPAASSSEGNVMSNKPHLRPHQKKRQARRFTKLLVAILVVAFFALDDRSRRIRGRLVRPIGARSGAWSGGAEDLPRPKVPAGWHGCPRGDLDADDGQLQAGDVLARCEANQTGHPR